MQVNKDCFKISCINSSESLQDEAVEGGGVFLVIGQAKKSSASH